MNKYVKGLWHPVVMMRQLFMLTTQIWLPDNLLEDRSMAMKLFLINNVKEAA